MCRILPITKPTVECFLVSQFDFAERAYLQIRLLH